MLKCPLSLQGYSDAKRCPFAGSRFKFDSPAEIGDDFSAHEQAQSCPIVLCRVVWLEDLRTVARADPMPIVRDRCFNVPVHLPGRESDTAALVSGVDGV